MKNDEPSLRITTVSSLIGSAFRHAAARHDDMHRRWITLSVRMGSLLPNSLLMFNVQQAGHLDIVLRSMEDELAATADGSEDAIDTLTLFSSLWVGQTYEIVRLLKERQLVVDDDEFDDLAHLLRLIRVPLEKHEIAADRKLEEDIQMARSPATGTESDNYVYRKGDLNRAHIMPLGRSEHGSVMWNVIDIQARRDFWLERRALSDKLLQLWEKSPAS